MSTKSFLILILTVLMIFTTSCESSVVTSDNSTGSNAGGVENKNDYVINQQMDSSNRMQKMDDGQESVSVDDSNSSSDVLVVETVPSFEIFNANARIKGLDGKGTPFYEMLVKPSGKLVYQQLAEYAMDEKGLYYTAGLWNTYFNDLFKNHPQYAYEAILMSYLGYDAESAELENSMTENVKSFGVDFIFEILGSVLDTPIKEDTNALSVKNQILKLPKDEASKVFREKILLEIDAGILKGIEEGMKSTPELISNLATLSAADQKRTGQIAYLKRMRKRISDNEPLQDAIDDIVRSYEGKSVFSLSSQTGKQNAYAFGKVLVSSGWENFLDFIDYSTKADPEMLLVLKSLKLGGSGLNALFGTTTLSEELMSVLTLYIIDNEMKGTLSDLKDKFIEVPSQDNAEAFNGAFEAYLHYQNYANTVAKQYINDIINSGVLTKTFTKIFHNENINTAEELMKCCDTQIANREKILEINQKYFPAYCRKYNLSAYEDAFNELYGDYLVEDSRDLNAIFENKIQEIEDEYGRVTAGENIKKYDSERYYSQVLSAEETAFDEGVVFTDILDYDKDGVSELLSIRRQNGNVEINEGDRVIHQERSEYVFEIYEATQDDCSLSDSITVGVFDIMNWSINRSNMSIFRHETDNNVDICVETYICQQDHPDDTSLIILRYENEKISLVDGIRFGYWFGENSVLCLEPASEKAIDFLSFFFPSTQTGWEVIVRSNDFNENYISKRKEKLKEMGYDLLQTRLDVENEYNKSEMDGNDYNEMNSALSNISAANCYSPKEGSLSMMAFLVEYHGNSEGADGQIGIVQSISIYDNDEPNSESAISDSEYILPKSDKILLTETDIDALDAESLMLARNEIYARHGRMFKDKKIQSYFDSKSWYKGIIRPEEFSENTLSDIERKNAEFILNYEKNIKNDEIYDYVINELHGLWYSATMDSDGPLSKMVCEGNNFNGEIKEIIEYHEGYLVRIDGGYSYYFGKSLDSCSFVDGWETTENNTSGASGWWKPTDEQRKQFGE